MSIFRWFRRKKNPDEDRNDGADAPGLNDDQPVGDLVGDTVDVDDGPDVDIDF